MRKTCALFTDRCAKKKKDSSMGHNVLHMCVIHRQMPMYEHIEQWCKTADEQRRQWLGGAGAGGEVDKMAYTRLFTNLLNEKNHMGQTPLLLAARLGHKF